MDRTCLAPSSASFAKAVAKAEGGRLGAARQLFRRRHLGVELLGLDLDLVEVATVTNEDVQRNHLDTELGKLLNGEVARAVTHNLELVVHAGPFRLPGRAARSSDGAEARCPVFT